MSDFATPSVKLIQMTGYLPYSRSSFSGVSLLRGVSRGVGDPCGWALDGGVEVLVFEVELELPVELALELAFEFAERFAFVFVLDW